MARPRGRAERQRAIPVPRSARRAAGAVRELHPRRVPDLYAHADSVADSVTDSDSVPHPDAGGDADAGDRHPRPDADARAADADAGSDANRGVGRGSAPGASGCINARRLLLGCVA